jgi:excisionase family DNA binding protein
MSEPSYLVGRSEAARLLGCSTKTIDRMCRRGELQKVHIGGRAMIERASLRALIQRLCGHAEAPQTGEHDRWGGWLPELARRHPGEASTSGTLEAA